MQSFQIGICEDDQSDLESLTASLKTILDSLNVDYHITCFDSGEALLASEADFGLIFLDIVMEGQNGLEIGRQIYMKNHTAKIIYQTNFGSFCKEAVNTVHAFAFLEKPLTEEGLREQVEQFLQQVQKENEILEFQKISFWENGILVESPVIQIPKDDIYYFEVMKSKRKIKIVAEHNIYEYSDTMNHLEARLQGFGFEISSRGVLVNLRNIANIKNYRVFMKNGETVALSQKRAVQFKERLNEYVHKGE